MNHRFRLGLLGAVLLASCAGHTRLDPASDRGREHALPDSQRAFWEALQPLCGKVFAGRLTEGTEPSDAEIGKQRLLAHFQSCDPTEMRIPFQVGDDRSRTWVLTRTAAGLRLKHDHRHADGTEDAISQYGGDTRSRGSPRRQEFPADAFTAQLIPAAATNVWAFELHPNQTFAYSLVRGARRFRVDFDLTRPIDATSSPRAMFLQRPPRGVLSSWVSRLWSGKGGRPARA